MIEYLGTPRPLYGIYTTWNRNGWKHDVTLTTTSTIRNRLTGETIDIDVVALRQSAYGPIYYLRPDGLERVIHLNQSRELIRQLSGRSFRFVKTLYDEYNLASKAK